MIGAPVVVTGAGGFLGRCLVSRLARDRAVVAVRRRQAGPHSHVREVVADLGPDWTAALPDDLDADALVWLAQSRRYREFPAGAADMFRVNEVALFAALEWARAAGVRRFIYASTGSVYAPSPAALNEDSPVEARSFYTTTKLNGENLVRQYADAFRIVIARIFALYGPGQQDMAVAKVIAGASRGETVQLSAGVGMIFSPLYVDDAAIVLTQLLEIPLPAQGLTVNVAGAEQVSLADVARITGQLAGVPVRTADSGGTAPCVVADTRLLRELLPEFRPRSMTAGVADTLGRS